VDLDLFFRPCGRQRRDRQRAVRQAVRRHGRHQRKRLGGRHRHESHPRVQCLGGLPNEIRPTWPWGRPATAPGSLAADASGNLWIADTGHNQIQKWRAATSVTSTITSEISIDGKTVNTKVGRCGTETCAITPEWILGAGAYTAGKHTLQVKATDGLGRSTSKTLTVELQKDVTKPTLETTGGLATAPEGWVEQETYNLGATATDAGYGVTSIIAKIDGQQVASWAGSCPDGGCKATISKPIDMSAYSGGSHSAEVLATDGAGNVSKQGWTINVDPEGHISSEETLATLEAVDSTSSVNTVGSAHVEDEYEGTIAGIGVQAGASGSRATETATPVSIAANASDGVTIEIPTSIATACGELGTGVTVELSGKEEEELPRGNSDGCPPASEAGSVPLLTPITVTPTAVLPKTGAQEVNPEQSATVAPNLAANVDLVTRPLFDGAMTFAIIRDSTAPETYSWNVDLEEDQQLKLIDAQHAAVLYTDGHPAFGITAEPAHDAVGTAVSTSLAVSQGKIITLTVGHKASNVVYPVTGGAGWEGGFNTYYVQMPPPEPLPEEEEGETEAEAEFEEVDGEARYTEIAMGPPVADISSVPFSAKQPASIGAKARAYNFFQCHVRGGYEGGIGGTRFREVAQGCHGSFPGVTGTGHVVWATSMSGVFHYKYGHWVWINEQPDCRKWGETWEKPAIVHCYATSPNPASVHLNVVSDLRFGEGAGWGSGSVGRASCATFEGVLPIRPGDARPFYGTMHLWHEWVWPDQQCPWGHFEHPTGH